MPPDEPDSIKSTGRSPRQEYKRLHAERKRRADGVQPVKIAACGTEAAYRRHRREHSRARKLIEAGRPDAKVGNRTAAEVAAEPACELCLEAHRKTAKDARKRRAALAAERSVTKPYRKKTRRKVG